MEEETGRNWKSEKPKKNDAYSKVVKAGKRAYFFDVRTTTPENELYIVITESKKCTDSEGHFFYERHKIFLYPEDIEPFSNGLSEVMGFVKNKKQLFTKHYHKKEDSPVTDNFDMYIPQLEESYSAVETDFQGIENDNQ
jgi:hypothetical protein